MKITIDVDKLLKEGRITSEEYTRLRLLAQDDTRRLGFNVLVAFGVLATAAGTIALLPSGITALVLGCALCAAGVWLRSAKFAKEWRCWGGRSYSSAQLPQSVASIMCSPNRPTRQ